MKIPKLSRVVETSDGIYINHHYIPYVLLKEDGSSTTKIEKNGNFVKVNITFMARSYTVNNLHKRRYYYKFKRHHLFSKLNTIKRELNHIKGSLFS